MNTLLVYQRGFSNELEDIKDFLKEHNIEAKPRDQLGFGLYEGKDLVVVLGGDGTFLRASHYNKDVPIFGINPRPDQKEGYYMQANFDNYRQELDLDGSFKVRDLLRLDASIDGDRIDEIALNDIYIGDSKPYNMFNYDITVADQSEFQRSSGVLTGTPSGSSGWIGSAGLHIKDEDKFGFVARELYRGELTSDYSLEQGLIDAGDSLKIKAKTPGIVVVDSVSKEYDLGPGSELEVKVSKHPLLYIIN
ncbi:MAG: NAD(+)/NADH kinase [Candidatus Paceibacteria bacterium]